MQIRPLREQYAIMDTILQERLQSVLAPCMEACGIDVWIIPSKEYNEDPIFQLMTPSGFPTARRLTILLFHAHDGGVDTYCVNRPDHALEQYYKRDYDVAQETQMEALTRVLRRLQPKTIGINKSANFAYCDGLSVGIYEQLCQELPAELRAKFVSADALGVRFLEKRTKTELHYYDEVMAAAMDIIDEAYSTKAIQVGVTNCNDLEWYMMQRVNSLGLTCWFPPTIDLQNENGRFDGDTVIQYGDLLHCDFGITYLGLCTDTQRLAYVLRTNEEQLPQSLQEGMAQNNRFQDIVCSHFKDGVSGNAVFKASLAAAAKEGIQAMLYTHPLGNHGHAAGPTIGLFSEQKEIKIQGDLLLHEDTCYALELNTRTNVAHYRDQPIWFFTEESVAFHDGSVHYLAPGRTSIKCIR